MDARCGKVLADYDGWLERQAIAPCTRTAYRRRVRALVEHLKAGDELTGYFASGDRWRRRLCFLSTWPSVTFGERRAYAGRIFELNRWRSPLSSLTRLSFTLNTSVSRRDHGSIPG